MSEYKNSIPLGFHVGVEDYTCITTSYEHKYQSRMAKSVDIMTTRFNSNTCQVFTHAPQNGIQVKDINIDEMLDIGKTKRIYVHSTYITAFKPDDKSRKHVENQLSICDKIKAHGWVVHLIKAPAKQIAEEIKYWLDNYKPNTIILLEMKAIKKADDSYETPEKLEALVKALKSFDITNQQVRICIDTAHIYTSYVDIKTYDEASEYLESCFNKFGDWIGYFHINGNRFNRDDKARDNHTIPFANDDHIWRDVPWEKSGMRAFVQYAKKYKIDIAFELELVELASKEFLKVWKNAVNELK